MPINRVKDGQGRSCFEFEFSRRIGGQRFRLRERLPAAWTRTEADAYDRKRCGEIYAQATGTVERRWLIDEAVACYLGERAVELKTGRGIAAEIRSMEEYWRGKYLSDLPAICAVFTKAHRAVLAPATIMNKLRYLVSACRFFWRSKQLGGVDPGAGIAMPAVSNKRHIYIDRADMLLLCQHTYDRPTRAAIRIAFYSGMRRGEILRAVQGGGAFVLEDTKNGERRIVPMHPRCRAYAHYEWPTKYKLGYWFRKARYQIARDDLHFHDLRHSAASAMIDEGVDLYTVGGVLGHKSAASTQRYAHLAQRKLRAAVSQIGRRA